MQHSVQKRVLFETHCRYTWKMRIFKPELNIKNVLEVNKMEKEFNPRKEGKLHYHEEIVRPIKVNVEKMVHKDPTKDMYYDAQDRKHFSRDADLPLRTINIHFSRLTPGESSRLHKHHNEAAVYIVQGKGYSMVQGERYDWEKGDFLYVPVFCWHEHFNTGEEDVIYMGITNKRMLDWLGLDRKVEAGVHMTMEEVQAEIEGNKFSPYSYYHMDPENGVKFGPENMNVLKK